MYKAPSKRRLYLQRAVVYSLMTIGVALLVTVLVFLMLGYRFNRATSTIEQGGLVQFASRPSDANVKIGSANLGDTTPSKITVIPDQYDVTISKRGYLPWTKNVSVQSGAVLWLNYAQLVPETIKTTQLQKFSELTSAVPSPNSKYFAGVGKPSSPTLRFIDVSGSEPEIKSQSIPSSELPSDEKISSLKIIGWSNDSERLLVSFATKTRTEWVWIDRDNPDRTVNLTRQFDTSIRQVEFDPRSSERLIVVTTEGKLRFINVVDDVLSAVLADNVMRMSTFRSDAVLMVRAPDPASRSIEYLTFGETTPREIKQFSGTPDIRFEGDRYFSDTFFAISTNKEIEVLKLTSLPASDTNAAISMRSVMRRDVPSKPSSLKIRAGGRLVVLEYKSAVFTYDIELDRTTITSLAKQTQQPVDWLDRFHIYTNDGTTLRVMEFDGANQHVIASAAPAFGAAQTDNGKYIYSFLKVSDGYSLQRSQMILD